MKTNLFIIGNGFDLGHEMKTSYNEFKNWINKEFPNTRDPYTFEFAYSITMPDGEEYVSEEDLASFLAYCIEETVGEDWSDFENSLGMIEWKDICSNNFEDIEDKEGDILNFRNAYAREDFTANLNLNSQAFSKLFSKWINGISYPKEISSNSFLTDDLKQSSLFLTFNYTKTLENVYNISPDRICHIHGVQNDDIIIGHGVGNSFDNEDNDDSDYDFGFEAIDEIHNSLRKPTRSIIENSYFLSDLSNYPIKNVFSWGFSFSEVDQCYIREICKKFDTTAITWHFHDRGNGEKEKFEKIVCECGFAGCINSFMA